MIDHLLMFWPLLIIYLIAIALLAIVLAYIERRRLVMQMHRMRRT